MNSLVPYGQRDLVLKTGDELPDYLSHSDYLRLREIVSNPRDLLLIDLLFETGGRCSDIAALRREWIDFRSKPPRINLYTRKTRKVVAITLSSELALDLSLFMQQNQDRNPLFGISRQRVWEIVQGYGKRIGLDLHPHMFRHGLAIHMLNSGAPIPVISNRLGHANTRITQEFYLRVTPEIQARFMEQVKFR